MVMDDGIAGRTRVRRHPERGTADWQVINRILDEGLIAHVGFVTQGQPFVIPMAYGRVADRLILHGSAASRLLFELATEVEACVAVTLLDGLVLARSTFGHSMNYRSVVCFGRARRLQSAVDERRALEILVEHLVPGRTREARGPDAAELRATAVLEFQIEEASAKARGGPPNDPASDLTYPVWAGVIPLVTVAGRPQPSPDLQEGIAPPQYVSAYRRPAFPEFRP